MLTNVAVPSLTAELHQRLYQKYFGAEPTSPRPFDAREQASINRRKNRIQDLMTITELVRASPGISAKALNELMPRFKTITPYLRELREMGVIELRARKNGRGYWSLI